MADHVGPDPVRGAGRRPAVAAGLVLVLAALAGELRAPAPVLPASVTLGLAALAVVVLAALVATTSGPALVTGRALRTAALVPIGLITFLVVGPRFRLLVVMLAILAGLLALAVAIAAVATVSTRRRDSVTALVAVVAVAVGGWFGAGVVREGRMAIHADRYRSEAEALIGRPIAGSSVWKAHGLDEPLAAFRTFEAVPGHEERRVPIAVAWLWDPGEDGPAASYGVLYAPDDGGLRAYVPTEGQASDCTATAVDHFYWCAFV
ncbi:MAG TPA: hypothetical protein VK507_02610 [Iamia sp.]|nr:hypothetical protein [Iamia sp.]